MNSNPYPLYEKVIERLEKKGVKLPPEVSPSYFLNHESDEAAESVISEFWMEAHTLSCLTRGSFYSSIVTTYKDVMPSLVETSDDVALGFVGGILTRNCALVKSDGTTINSYGENTFRTACCIENGNSIRKMNKQQLKTVADLTKTRTCSMNAKQFIKPTKGGGSQSSWVEYVTSPVRTISRGLHNVIDSVLGDEFAPKINTGGSVDMDDAAITSPKSDLNQIDEDDELISKERRGVINRHPVEKSDELISLDTVTCAIEGLLVYAARYCECKDMFFVLHSNDGTVDQVILHTNSNSGSLYSLCRLSGEYYSSSKEPNDVDQKDAAKVLSTLSKEDMSLIAESLISSNHAIKDKETITLFPRGIPQNYEKSKSDNALFQIHTTRISIQHRMKSLEKHAITAEKNAVNAKRDGMTKLALMHMKRRKSIFKELERCATLIANLDAAELRLNRAKDDAQLIETFAMLKTTLQDIRTSNDVDKTDVEELMLDIQEELDATNLDSLYSGTIGPDIDDAELDAEFQRLELECAVENESKVYESCIKSAKIGGADEEKEVPKIMILEEMVSKHAERVKVSDDNAKSSVPRNQDSTPIPN